MQKYTILALIKQKRRQSKRRGRRKQVALRQERAKWSAMKVGIVSMDNSLAGAHAAEADAKKWAEYKPTEQEISQWVLEDA